MKAFALNGFDSPPALQELPDPEVGPGHVRLRVRAAALNRMDAAIRSGMVRGIADYQFPVVLGRDGAGLVDALGQGVDDVSIGDEVIGHVLFGPVLRDGTIAEYAVVAADTVAAKPEGLDFTAAAALPLAGTAALAAVEAIEPTDGSSVLIAGASGGVGSFAIQLAAARGATVIATGLPDEADRLRGLGASRVVDYREDVVTQVLDGDGGTVDALIDLVSYEAENLARLAAAVRKGGKVSSTVGAATPEALAAREITGTNIMAVPSRETLAALLAEIERGMLRVDVEETLPLEDAPRGLDAFLNGHVRGKTVVTVG
jgi:NADPH:quinone reductase-like Zn-dependent oxidoreductase